MNSKAKEIAKKSKSSFYYAFNLLTLQKREAMTTLYAFCRETDENNFQEFNIFLYCR